MRACSGHLDRARQRQRRPRRRRRARPRGGAAGPGRLPLRRVWLTRRGGAGLLLRLRQRRPVAAVPRRARAAGVPRSRLGALPRGQPALRRRGGGRGAQRRPDRAGAGLPLRAAAGDGARASCRARPSSPSGTSPGPTPSRSASARGGARSWKACSAARSSASTRASTARTSSRRSTATSRRASSTSTRRSRSSGERDAGRELSDLDRVAARSDARAGRRSAECRPKRVRAPGPAARHLLAVGVDRFDYTKGILERLHAVERMLEKHPEWHRPLHLRAGGRAVAQRARRIPRVPGAHRAQVASASTSASAAAATSRCPPAGAAPRARAVDELYRAADVCVVTSLHDGMNLVCKEFVAARDDEQGVLILSRFAGAARELPEALIVNPYHVEETADALHRALDHAARPSSASAWPACAPRCASSTSTAGPGACCPTPAAGACASASRRACSATGSS